MYYKAKAIYESLHFINPKIKSTFVADIHIFSVLEKSTKHTLEITNRRNGSCSCNRTINSKFINPGRITRDGALYPSKIIQYESGEVLLIL